ncbi:arginine/ornithine transport system permease protein [Pelomonas saccharophila]|uniref:Arginine/ornithine transport system permease protein n=1 Tax=Roseateles saccharophilus TaxID=304 RepID=A0ABU1YFG0_ROSSA|nr:ABC transporter permease [Roseateles saccharophilus]MDR7267592.1 arginine/ornithine transport system permease protein [Roseateles saccharophilus]
MLLHGFLPSLLEGSAVTLAVALSSLAIAALLGLMGALAKLSRSRVARGVAATYTTLIRGVPDLVLMLLVFYGGQLAINAAAPMLGHEDYIDIDPFFAGVLTIGFIFGAYLTEAFRGAFLAVPPGQREAGLAYGMSPRQVLWRITLPQMLRHALPGISNNWLVLIKSTAIVSVIGLSDLMTRGKQAAGTTREPFTFFLAVAIIYLVFTSVSELVFAWAQKRLAIGTKRGQL